MPNLSELIEVCPATRGPLTAYYRVGHGVYARRESRLSFRDIYAIRSALANRSYAGKPVIDEELEDLVLAFLPNGFRIDLKSAGITVLDAWAFVDAATPRAPENVTSPEKRNIRASTAKAMKLAAILTMVSGECKTPDELCKELVRLFEDHAKEACSILAGWIDEFGYSRNGGHIIVGNKKNRAMKASTNIKSCIFHKETA